MAKVSDVTGDPCGNRERLFRLLLDTFICRRRGTPMAQKVSVTYACDYDKKEIQLGQERTRAFGLDGRGYEIDLCRKHSDKLDEIMGRYISIARKAAVRGVRRRTAAHRQRSAQIRAWAKSRGLQVSDRGRIPSDVVNRYETAHR